MRTSIAIACFVASVLARVLISLTLLLAFVPALTASANRCPPTRIAFVSLAAPVLPFAPELAAAVRGISMQVRSALAGAVSLYALSNRLLSVHIVSSLRCFSVTLIFPCSTIFRCVALRAVQLWCAIGWVGTLTIVCPIFYS